jgi:hypothetical protein
LNGCGFAKNSLGLATFVHAKAVFIGYAVFERDMRAANPAAERGVFLEHGRILHSLRINSDDGDAVTDIIIQRHQLGYWEGLTYP